MEAWILALIELVTFYAIMWLCTQEYEIENMDVEMDV
jgi:hypothetical protein